jgi:hypothetical protein
MAGTGLPLDGVRVVEMIHMVMGPTCGINNFNADGAPFRVPPLPVERNGGNIGEGLRVPVLGADTEAISAELEKQNRSSTDNAA